MPQQPAIHPGDVIQLRKPHPCGSDTWTVVHVGSDMILENTDCNRRITLTRSKFNKAVKRIIPADRTP